MLACADLGAALAASFALALVSPGESDLAVWAVAVLPLWVLVAKLVGLYDRDERPLRHSTIDEVADLVLWAVAGTSLLSLVLVVTPAGPPDASAAVVAGATAITVVFILRVVARRVWRAVAPPERVAIVGGAAERWALKRKLELFPDLHMEVVEERDALDADAREVASLLHAVDRLVYAPASIEGEETREVLGLSEALGGLLTVVLPWRDAFRPAVRLNHLAELPVLEYKRRDPSAATMLLKRAIDVVGSALALALLAPLFLLIAAAIKLDSRGPVLFAQVRAGAGGRPFRMLKFRSMVVDAEERLAGLVSFDRLPEPVFKLHDDPRITRLGRLLRRWSLDELPQLGNVLIGQMSLVGPRPEQLELVERYAPEHRYRLTVKPGLTGPMQVHGRGELTFAERLAVERDYIENPSIVSDLRIMAMTIPAALSGRGAY